MEDNTTNPPPAAKKNSPVPTLVELGKIDARAAFLNVQLKNLANEHRDRTQALQSAQNKREIRAKSLSDKRSLVAKEEKAVKFERDKINERRRALGTLNNYKLQQAAEREIDYVSKQIGQREDLLLGLMRDVEGLEKEMVDIESALEGFRGEVQAFETAMIESQSDWNAELATLKERRHELTTALADPQVLSLYNRVVAKFPGDPVVILVNRESCAGCFMKVGPQVQVQISRGDIVKCPGCARILRLEGDGGAG
jgi:predicted  nucleic acid-binding Zn-ribbon protein